MTLQSVDRTPEQEISRGALTVSTEDTCCFWTRKERSLLDLKRCFYCKHFLLSQGTESMGVCLFKDSHK